MNPFIEKLRELSEPHRGFTMPVQKDVLLGAVAAYDELQRRVDELEEEKKEAALDAWGDALDRDRD